jgi:hypothetical protein
MKQYIIFYIIGIVIFLVGCTNGNIEKGIVNKSKSCKSENCVVKITELTDFSWDRMVVFSSPEPLEVISPAIGIDYSKYYEEFSRPIIFLKGNQIVHYENNPADAEHFIDGQVVFDYPDSLTYVVYTPKEAIFNITSKNIKNGTYYILSQH